MNETIQKASIWKRISAFLLDSIIVTILATGIAFATSAITKFDSYYDAYTEAYNAQVERYKEEYGYDFSTLQTMEEIEALGKECVEIAEKFEIEFSENEDAMRNYRMTYSLVYTITSVSVITSFLLAEFVLPIIFKNGQTVGKKIFGIAVIRNDCVKVSNIQMFMRSMVGKCAVETMAPILIILNFNNLGLIGLIIIVALLLFQLILCIASKNNLVIHDVFAYTVVVDMNSQKIFKDQKDKLEYQKQLAKEEAKQLRY